MNPAAKWLFDLYKGSGLTKQKFAKRCGMCAIQILSLIHILSKGRRPYSFASPVFIGFAKIFNLLIKYHAFVYLSINLFQLIPFLQNVDNEL